MTTSHQTGQLVAEKSALLKWLEKHMVDWHRFFPGLEQELAQHLLPFLPHAAPLCLKPPQKLHWIAYRHAITWVGISSIVYVNPKDVDCDSPSFSLAKVLSDTIEDMLTPQQNENGEIEVQGQWRCFSGLANDTLFHTKYVLSTDSSGNSGESKDRTWDIGSGLGTIKRKWTVPIGSGSRTVVSVLDHNLEIATCLAAYWLLNPLSIFDRERAYLLLKMWGSGNYPLGIDQHANLIVLADI
jgi:hypothetical protein